MNTIASRWTKHAKLAAHTWGHRPNASLHHQFGNIPNRLDFDDLAVGDPDTPAEALTFTVLDSVGGSLAVDGQPSTTFTLAEISAGQVTFTDAVSDETAPSFTFVVVDTHEDDSSPTQTTDTYSFQARS